MFLRQSTTQTVRFGPFVDSTDGDTAETALTIAQADRRLSKDGGAFAQSNHTGNSTHDSDGWYSDDLDTTDTNTVGELLMNVHVSGALQVVMRWWVLEETAYDEFAGDGVRSAVGAVDDAAAAGDPSTTESVMQYVKQLVNVLVGTDGIGTFPAEAAPANAVSLAEVIRAIHADVTGLNGDAMRGTDNAALASVVGALNDTAAAGDPTNADTVVQYLKQLINVLVGTDGIGTFPAEAAPANAVSLAEVIRAIHADVTGLNGDAMRGTDSAYTGTPPTAAAIADAVWDELQADHTTAATFGLLASEIADILADTNELQGDWANGGRLDLILDATATQATADAIETDTQDIQGRLPSALVGGRMDSDMSAISTSATAADNLEQSALGIVTGTAQGTPTTTVIDTDLTEATDDHYNGRILTFVTGAVAGQSTDITDYNGTTNELTVTALTNAPSSGDAFVIT